MLWLSVSASIEDMEAYFEVIDESSINNCFAVLFILHTSNPSLPKHNAITVNNIYFAAYAVLAVLVAWLVNANGLRFTVWDVYISSVMISI